MKRVIKASLKPSEAYLSPEDVVTLLKQISELKNRNIALAGRDDGQVLIVGDYEYQLT